MIDEDGLLVWYPDHREWLEDHEDALDRYLFYTHKSEKGREYIKKFFLNQEPGMGCIIVKDFETNSESLKTNQAKTIKHMTTEGEETTLLSGSRGSGKTYEAISLIGEIHRRTGATRAYIGVPNKELDARGWVWRKNLGELQEDDCAMYDEAVLFLNSRRSMSATTNNVLMYIPTLRHRNVVQIFFLTQSTKRSDVALIDWANTHIIKEYSDVYGVDVERGQVDDILLDFMTPRMNYVIPSRTEEWSFVKTNNFKCLKNSIPVPWYSDKIGKAFGVIDNEGHAMAVAEEMVKNSIDIKEVRMIMALKGWDRPLKFWEEMADAVNTGGYGTYIKNKAEQDGMMDAATRLLSKDVFRTLDNQEAKEYIENLDKGKIRDTQKPKKF
jgi:hypothetical protein